MSEWISVEDRLPAPFIEVLCYNPNRRDKYGTGYWVDRDDFRDGQFWVYRGSSGGSKNRIASLVPTYWTPLPEAP